MATVAIPSLDPQLLIPTAKKILEYKVLIPYAIR